MKTKNSTIRITDHFYGDTLEVRSSFIYLATDI